MLTPNFMKASSLRTVVSRSALLVLFSMLAACSGENEIVEAGPQQERQSFLQDPRVEILQETQEVIQEEPQEETVLGDTFIETPTGNCMVSETSVAMLRAVNNARAQGQDCGQYGYFSPAQALVMSCELVNSAQFHADDMALNNYFSHTSLNGDSPFDRMEAAGFEGSAGENIAFGQRSIAEVTEDWLNSDGHCRNIMDSEYRELGTAIGVRTSTSAGGRIRDTIYWVQNFGRR